MAALSETIHGILEQAVQNGEVAGMSVLVIKNGEEIAYTDAGFATVETGKPFARDTICRAYSMSKPVTGVAAMILLERGILDPGMAVGDVIPAYRDVKVWENGKKVAPKRNLLIKDLLSMTSGLSYPGMDESGQEVARVFEEADARLYGDDPMTTMELAERIAGCGLAFHPGERWMYGTSADILAAVIEKLAGMPYGEFLKKEIFEPLGMNDTGFYVPAEKQHRLADAYKHGSKERTVTNNLAICYTLHREAAFQSGGAGLVTTIDDYSKLAQSLLGHGKAILKPETVRYLTGGRLLPWQLSCLWHDWETMSGYDYGNLMRVLTQPGMAMLNGWEGEYGWDGWLGTYFINSPKNDVTVLMFAQRIDAGTMEVTRKVRNVLTAQI